MKNALNILDNREFISQSKINHWLGNGVYFFVNDPDAAEWWGNMKSPDDGAVMSAEIELDESEILDLDTLTGANVLNEFYDLWNDLNSDLEFPLETIRFIKDNPSQAKHVQMSIVLDLIFEMYGYKACMYSFVIERLQV